ncbi:MAG: threonine/serine dehydratase [Candidatus Bathyarchaeota archaeon]|jgi:threonine dehydratase|nr:threonine/serine dehydratase [Candidatus Bathyarchaeota archaeon]
MFQNLQAAHERLKGTTLLTPVMTSSTLNKMVGARCFLKCENFQKAGAFKFRGAFFALTQLTPEQRERGVITHSSGNHAQALALAAKIQGIKAVVVMPRDASPAKVSATKSYGAQIVRCGSNPVDREEAVKPLIEMHGYTLIHPSNDLNIIAGAGTAAYELIEEVGKLDYVLCAVGGGGLLSGTSIATRNLLPSAEVVGVEPKNADDAYLSYQAKKIVPSRNPTTIADGLRTSLGSETFRIILENVDRIITVEEGEIVDAMRFLWERMKLVVEPSGAVSLAGVLSRQLDLASEKVGVIISGGNVDLASFFEMMKNGLL